MKKRLLVIPLVVVLSLFFAAPVFAADPPGVDVQVGVTTPGDVGVGIDINAGGDVTVDVNGAPMASQGDLAAALSSALSGGAIGYYGFLRHFEEEIAPYRSLLANHGAALNLLTGASAKLIKGQELSQEEIGNINVALQTLMETLDTAQANTNTAISNLKAQDDKTWNQLMYGAEAHLSILQGVVDEQTKTIASQQSQLELQNQKLGIANSNYIALLNYTDYLQRQYLYYFWILGGCMIVLLALVVWALARVRRRG